MAISQEDILEAVSNMTVMEIVDLISAMEEKFGVTAAVARADCCCQERNRDGGGELEVRGSHGGCQALATDAERQGLVR